MKHLELLIQFFFPSTMILSKSQISKSKKDDHKLFRSTILYTLPLVALAYIGHYYLLDLPLNLQPKKLWFFYRFGIAVLCFIGFTYYFFNHQTKYLPYKLVATLISLTICYYQAKTILWYDQVPYLYAFTFILLTGYILRLSPSQFLSYSLIALALEWLSLQQTSINTEMLLSGSFVTLFFGCMLAAIKYFQIRVFVTNEKLFSEQQRNIEQNIEFTERLKSFLPKKIASRLDQKVARNHITIHQAVDEVLRPQKKNIACLTCDIRGYTSKSKKNTSYILDSVIPLTKRESQIVENHDGIPRKIGDMLFCYYDSNDIVENVKNSLLTAFEIAHHEIEHNKNKTKETKVTKQVLISIGEAIVGNIGGLDSSVEITAMGTPVNFISRLEDIVKSDIIRPLISELDIIISKEVFTLLSTLGVNVQAKEHSLSQYKLQIKDFEEVTSFYTLRANNLNEQIINELNSPLPIINQGIAS